MKRNISLFITMFFALIALSVLLSSYFIVNETEQVVITRFGKVIGKPIQSAGIHFKIPWIDKANFYDKRILEWDGSADTILLADKNTIKVDATARWKIRDPLAFLQDVGTEELAQQRLDGIIDSAVRTEISQHHLVEIVRNSNRAFKIQEDFSDDFDTGGPSSIDEVKVGRDKISRNILAKAKKDLSPLGIELIDVRIKGLMYDPSVQQKIYSRMISEQKKIAEKIRSQGQGEKARIEGRQNLDLKTIQSEAYKQAQIIQGEADASAAKIYSEGYALDPSFYEFLAALDAYDDAITSNSVMVIGTDADFFKTLKSYK